MSDTIESAKPPRLRLVPDNPGLEFPHIGFCNSDLDCTATCRLVQESPKPCPRGKTGLKWDIAALVRRNLLGDPP